MGALGTLGIGLSVLFGVFLAVLAGEVYYMLCCRRVRRQGGAVAGVGVGSRSRVNSVQVVEAAASAEMMQQGGFAREAALVGSFGGYPGAPLHSDFVSKFFPPSSLDDDVCLPHNFLFPIAEETKEEMELHADTPPPMKLLLMPPPPPPPPPLPPISSVNASVAAPSVCASSTSVSFSTSPDATPFATPPSSPSGSDTSSDRSLSYPAESPATAVSRFSAQSWSPASASSSPATAVSRFSVYSQSPTSVTASPATAASRRSVNSPVSVAVSPAYARLTAATPASTSPSLASQRSSLDAVSDHGPLGALFRRPYNSPSRYSPLRPVAWASQVTDFRHALPFSPPNNASTAV